MYGAFDDRLRDAKTVLASLEEWFLDNQLLIKRPAFAGATPPT